MFSIIRPVLFKIDPEIAHNLAIKSLKLQKYIIQFLNLVLDLLKLALLHLLNNMEILNQEYLD